MWHRLSSPRDGWERRTVRPEHCAGPHDHRQRRERTLELVSAAETRRISRRRAAGVRDVGRRAGVRAASRRRRHAARRHGDRSRVRPRPRHGGHPLVSGRRFAVAVEGLRGPATDDRDHGHTGRRSLDEHGLLLRQDDGRNERSLSGPRRRPRHRSRASGISGHDPRAGVQRPGSRVRRLGPAPAPGAPSARRRRLRRVWWDLRLRQLPRLDRGGVDRGEDHDALDGHAGRCGWRHLAGGRRSQLGSPRPDPRQQRQRPKPEGADLGRLDARLRRVGHAVDGAAPGTPTACRSPTSIWVRVR
jgi:hypothetical protein